MLRRDAKDLEFYVTNTEVEALILENNLIKKHRPRYNVLLKDDKTYPYIEIRLADSFPGIYFSRKNDCPGSRYFGPYPSAGAVRRIIGITEKFFHLRTCGKEFENRERPCLKYQVKRCSAPCVGSPDPDVYRESVNRAVLFLGGHYEKLEMKLTEEMERFSESLAFERAAQIRDLLFEIRRFKARQSVFLPGIPSLDAVAARTKAEKIAIVMLHFRSGRLLDKSEYLFDNEDNLFRHVLEQHISRLRQPLPLLLVNRDGTDREILEHYHFRRFGKTMEVRVPKRGRFLSVIKMAEENADEVLRRAESRGKELETLQTLLKLRSVPKRIECVDISHLGGTFTVGSLVVFRNGEPDKREYRRFRIRHGGGNDDFRSVAELVRRRYSRLLREKKPLPDLILIDGGKGQLKAAELELNRLGIADQVDLAALAKKEETVFSNRIPDGIRLDFRDAPVRVLTRIRDEAHRFAIAFNRRLRGKSALSPRLIEVPGIGEVKARRLLLKFGSLDAVLRQSDDALAAVLTGNEILNLREYFGKP